MEHIFITPKNISSPRWYQALERVRESESLPGIIPQGALLWVLLVDAKSLSLVSQLATSGTRVIALTGVESPQEARAALEAGASGYLHYLAVPEVLQQVVTVVTAAGLWLGSDLMRQLITATARQLPPTPQVDLSQLTQRERRVAEAVAAGKTNKEVARELEITERTVKAHLGAVFDKLNVRDRLQLVLVLSGKNAN